MLKIPFFNRKNYILLKFYCAEKTVNELAPVVKSSKIPHPFEGQKDPNTIGFNSCYGYVKTLKYSATLPAWSDFRVENKNKHVSFPVISPCVGRYIEDLVFRPKDVGVIKLDSPWVFESSHDCNIVLAQHILNTSGMIIASGILRPAVNCVINLFNYVPKDTADYTVKFNTPLVSFFPMSEKPLYVESYYDREKFLKLQEASIYPISFKGSFLKIEKLKDAKTQKKGATEAAPFK